VIVVLAEPDECARISRRDLPALHRDRGLKVVEFPVRDLGSPSPPDVDAPALAPV
jgi:hypothetical protein